jgi:hypothetical protein
MLLLPPARPSQANLEQAIERRIAQRTWGRVRRLQVARTDSRLVVRGFTESYYVKQLTIQAVLELLESWDQAAPEVDIQVEVYDGSAAGGCGAAPGGLL